MKRKKVNRARLIAALLLALLLTSAIGCSYESESNEPISLATSILCNEATMAKSSLRGEEIKFSASDFARAVNLESIESLTITTLPPTSDGELRVGSTVLNGSQTLSASAVSLLSFTASDAISCSSFGFRVNDLPYELTCKLYTLEDVNYAPTLSLVPKTATEVCVYENVTYFGTLPCYDADGDETAIEIVSYPEKGILMLEDRATGSYQYIPNADATGKDSFVCVARDVYGNYSPALTVSLEIQRSESSARFVDLAETPYHTPAITLNEKGIMSGTRVGSLLYFYPDRELTRAEFTMMAMNAAGITDVNSVSTTVFADDADIPDNMKGFIAAAYDLGYIKGNEVDGELCFEPQRSITKAEAAVMLANILDAATPTFKPSFNDSDTVPTWASASIDALYSIGVMSTVNGEIQPLAALTRGEAATILANFIEARS